MLLFRVISEPAYHSCKIITSNLSELAISQRDLSLRGSLALPVGEENKERDCDDDDDDDYDDREEK